MTPPPGVKVTSPEIGPECWVLAVGGREVCWRFWPAQPEGKRPHDAFVTLEGWPHGPVSAADMDRLAAAAAAVAERMRADVRAAASDQAELFTREVA